MLFALSASNWSVQDPAAGVVVAKPTQDVPPGHVLEVLFPAHQT
jgi:hypothetical protein